MITPEQLKQKHSITNHHVQVTIEYAIQELHFAIKCKNIHTIATRVKELKEIVEGIKKEQV